MSIKLCEFAVVGYFVVYVFLVFASLTFFISMQSHTERFVENAEVGRFLSCHRHSIRIIRHWQKWRRPQRSWQIRSQWQPEKVGRLFSSWSIISLVKNKTLEKQRNNNPNDDNIIAHSICSNLQTFFSKQHLWFSTLDILHLFPIRNIKC